MDNIALKIRQFRHECDSWKRNLEFMMQENVHLKNRLAEVISSAADDDLLTVAEEYQNRFTREDESFQLLRRDIAELEKVLTREIYEDGILIKDVVHKRKKLSNEIEISFIEFNKLRSDFNNYIREVS